MRLFDLIAVFIVMAALMSGPLMLLALTTARAWLITES